jgi:hypothetical protein
MVIRSGLPRVAVVSGALSLLSLAGCGSTSDACGVPVREELDPSHLLHVTDPSVAKYATDPPTSGAHLATSAPGGLVRAPMLPAVQITILERGDILVQYRDAEDLPALEGLVTNRIVVAPQPSLPARIVVTAWTYKLTCKAVDADAINAFADAHAGKAQEH